MTSHDNPTDQIDLFGYVPPDKKTKAAPAPETQTIPDEKQITLPIAEVKAEKTTADRIKQIQELLIDNEPTTLALRTTKEREADTGEHYQGYGTPDDEKRIEAIQLLTDRGEGGATLLILKQRLPLSTTQKGKGTAAGQPLELYFCPNGIDGRTEAKKIKPGVTTAEFVKQWND